MNGSWNIQERFLEFFYFFRKTGEEIAHMIISRLRHHATDLKDGRALEKIIASGKLIPEAHSNAQGLYKYVSSFRAILLATIWVKVLQCFEERNKILQTKWILELPTSTTFPEDIGPLDLLNQIYDLQLQGIFGQVCIALRIFPTLSLSLAEG
ncbi:uncharacterized protein PAF06_011176 [Gastrophryne carolinensis]